MKNTQILIIAAALGVCGALLNFAYLASRARDIDKVEFIAIKSDKGIGRGEVLTKDMLMPVGIPKDSVGNLEHLACRYEDGVIQSVVDRRVSRDIPGGELLLRADVRTNATELELEKDDELLWVPLESRAFVAALIDPGDYVTFLVPTAIGGAPTRAPARETKAEARPDELEPIPASPVASGTMEEIGPFKVLSFGNRLGSARAMQALKIQQVQENVLGIRVKTGTAEVQKAKHLMERLQAVAFRQVAVKLHSKKADFRTK